MNRLILFILCLILLGSAGPGEVCAQDAAKTLEPATPERSAAKAKTTKALAKKPTRKKSTAKSQTAKDKAAKDLMAKAYGAKPGLTQEDLAAPYSAGSSVFGPPRPPAQPGADNATDLRFDPEPKDRPFAKPLAKQEEPSPVNLRFGREQVVDPLTRREVTPKPDAAAAKESIKKMDFKGALDKVGGKAEVQVDILKF